MGVESSRPEEPPRYVAGFELTQTLSRGRFTTTYRVRRSSWELAMKVLDRGDDRQFRRMAAALAATDHPGLARVRGAGTADGRPYLVMDFVDGRPLSRVLGGGRLAVHDTIRLAIDVAGALAAAHRVRLVHGDLGPDDILIGPGGAARVVGFGLAVPSETGCADGRTDLHALGAVLYECVMGRRLPGSGPVEPRAIRPELPPALAQVIGKLLAPDPDDRYQSCEGLLTDLWRLATGVELDFAVGRADGPATRHGPPLLGRDGEVVTLLRRCHDVRGGAGGAVVLLGPAGSGKSRLADEVMAVLRLEGDGPVLTGECEPDEGVPLAPLRRAIDDHLRTVAGQRPALDRIRAAAGPTASLLRGLTLALDDVLEAPALDEADRDAQFLVAVADFLAALATSSGGAVLYLDDVHWMDPATRRVLRHLAGKLNDTPLLVVLAGRDDDRSAAAMALNRSALGDASCLEIPLSALPAHVVASLVSAVTGGLQIDAAGAAVMAEQCGGNTFALLKYVDALIDAGLLQPDWGRWRLDAEAAAKLVPTDDGVELILRRVDQLDADSRSVLGVGAVYGGVFDYHLIARACGLPRLRALDVAGTAAWRDLAERRPDGRYAFLHDSIREALVSQYEPEALRDVHEGLADALAEADGGGAEAIFALARHCVLGHPDRDPERAVRACSAAGQLALADHAPLEAVRQLESAQRFAQIHGVVLGSAILTALATARQRAGRFVSAARTAREALERSSDPIERARLLGLIAQSSGTVWDGERESDTILRALRELGRRPARRIPFLLLSTLWTVLLGQLSRLTRLGRGTARGRVREAYQVEARLYAAAARTYGLQLRPVQGLLCLLRQAYPVTRLGPGPEMALLRTGFAFVGLSLGLRGPARRNTFRAAAIAGRVGDPTLTGELAWMDAFNRHTFGIDDGHALRTVLDRQGHWLDLGTRIDLILILLWDALHRGDVAEAQRLADRRDALIRDAGEPDSDAAARLQSATVARGALAALAAWQDRPDEADRRLHRADDDRLARWERLPLYGTAVAVAYQRNDLGEAFDRAVDAFDALDLPVRILLPVGLGFCVYAAQGRVEQYRLATGADRDFRAGQARRALRRVRGVVRTPVQRAQVELAGAALLQAAGRPQAALDRLARHRTVGAASLTFDAARVRALALRDLHETARSEEQARLALHTAQRHGWPHRVRQITAEFGTVL